jgi:Tol biopolymer transport system component
MTAHHLLSRALRLSTILMLLASASLFAQTRPAVALKAAMDKEVVDGDLRGAIDAYKKIVDTPGVDRATAAQALVRMADCYQRLGDAEARKIYERLVREFADQQEIASLAKTKLGTPTLAVRGDRAIWTGPAADGFGTVSADGRYMTFTDWPHGAGLVLRDLQTGVDRTLTDESGTTQFSVLSKSAREVAYQWFPRAGGRPELRVVATAPNAVPRSLYANDEVRDVAPFDWSSDGKWIAALGQRADRTVQIALVNAQSGELRVLQSLDWKAPIKMFFSPDSRFVAYDLPVSETTTDRHVYIMAIDGSTAADAVVHASRNVIMGWSPDGRNLLFSSDRGGKESLWAVAVRDGKPAGAAWLVQSDIASSWSMGVTASGTMFVWKSSGGLSVQTIGIDLPGAKLLPAQGTAEQFIRSRGRPEWSPDGKSIAFESCTNLGGGPCTIYIWSLETGKSRELATRIKYANLFRWSPDGRFLITFGSDFRGRTGIYRIDVATGESSAVLLSDDTHQPTAFVQWAADGRSIYYRQRDPRMLVLRQHDLASGAEREVLRIPAEPSLPAMSPDGGWLVYLRKDGGVKKMMSVPLAGGEPRQIMTVNDPDSLYPTSWSSDSQQVLIAKIHDETVQDLWLAPVNGGSPRRIEGDVTSWTPDSFPRLSPDGKQVAFVRAAGKPGYEIWALESFRNALKADR